jgi:hypothetical protein
LLQAVNVVDLSSIISADETFREVPAVPVLGLAVLLGFSERFFNQLGDQAEKVIAGEPDRGSAAAAGSTTPSFRQRSSGDGRPESVETQEQAPATDRGDQEPAPAAGLAADDSGR